MADPVAVAPRPSTSLTVSGPGWFLVGDAAGLVDPITREGIYFALRSGELRGRGRGIAGASRTQRYRDRVRDEIAAELARAARFKAGFFRPRFTRLLLDALERQRRHPGGHGRSRRRDARAYATLKWSLAGTLEVGLAWRLLTRVVSGP